MCALLKCIPRLYIYIYINKYMTIERGEGSIMNNFIIYTMLLIVNLQPIYI